MLSWFWQSVILGRGHSSNRIPSGQKKTTSLDVSPSFDKESFSQEKRYSRSSNNTSKHTNKSTGLPRANSSTQLNAYSSNDNNLPSNNSSNHNNATKTTNLSSIYSSASLDNNETFSSSSPFVMSEAVDMDPLRRSLRNSLPTTIVITGMAPSGSDLPPLKRSNPNPRPISSSNPNPTPVYANNPSPKKHTQQQHQQKSDNHTYTTSSSISPTKQNLLLQQQLSPKTPKVSKTYSDRYLDLATITDSDWAKEPQQVDNDFKHFETSIQKAYESQRNSNSSRRRTLSSQNLAEERLSSSSLGNNSSIDTYEAMTSPASQEQILNESVIQRHTNQLRHSERVAQASNGLCSPLGNPLINRLHLRDSHRRDSRSSHASTLSANSDPDAYEDTRGSTVQTAPSTLPRSPSASLSTEYRLSAEFRLSAVSRNSQTSKKSLYLPPLETVHEIDNGASPPASPKQHTSATGSTLDIGVGPSVALMNS